MTSKKGLCYTPCVIVDFHTHIFPPQVIQEREVYLSQDRTFATMYSHPQAKMTTAEGLIASMDKAGIERSVVLNIGWTAQNLCIETNDYIMKSVQRYPDRLVGFCSINPLDEGAADEVQRCAREGLKGVGELHPDVQGYDLGDERVLTPVMEAAKRHGMIILTHASEPVGHLYPGKGKVSPAVLYRFISQFPEHTIVCAHWGGGLPFYALMPEVAKALKNVYFDSAASPFLYRPEVFLKVMDLVGVEKILFGTDYPLIQQKRLLDQIDGLALSPNKRELILSGNAQRVLGLDR